ncbi:MAG TPA: hypothetical protein PLB35_03440 [Myxococcota bacterium]|nr:hypothetical protein [Myxococcota bacterium]HOH76284.1 hypothetical protein [Myxococcota bacterium]
MIVDLHVCIPPSMTDEVIESVLDSCRRAGLDGACLVGIDSVPPVERIRELAGDLAVFFGVEFSLPRGRLVWIPTDVSHLGHALPFGRSLEEMVAFFKAEGGVMFAAHPYDRSDGPAFSDGIYDLDDISGIEVANAGRDPWKNNMAQDAVVQLKLKGFGGTGRHEAGAAEIGSAATLILDDAQSQADLVAQLGRDDLWAVEFLSDASQFGEDGGDDGHREHQGGHQCGGQRRQPQAEAQHGHLPGGRPASRTGGHGPQAGDQRRGQQRQPGGGRPQQRPNRGGQGGRRQAGPK